MSRTKTERDYIHPGFNYVECKILKENGKYVQVNYWKKQDYLDVAVIKNWDKVNEKSEMKKLDHPIRYCRECAEIEKPDVSACPICGKAMMIFDPEASVDSEVIPHTEKLINEEKLVGER